MPYGPTRTDEVEAALVALATAAFASAPITNIAALAAEDLDKDDNVVLPAPAARFVFLSEDMVPLVENEFLDYKSSQNWVLLLGAQVLSTMDAERAAAQKVLELAKNALSGARLALTSNPDGAIIGLRKPSLYQMSPDGTWFALRLVVKSFSSFTANIGTIR